MLKFKKYLYFFTLGIVTGIIALGIFNKNDQPAPAKSSEESLLAAVAGPGHRGYHGHHHIHYYNSLRHWPGGVGPWDGFFYGDATGYHWDPNYYYHGMPPGSIQYRPPQPSDYVQPSQPQTLPAATLQRLNAQNPQPQRIERRR